MSKLTELSRITIQKALNTGELKPIAVTKTAFQHGNKRYQVLTKNTNSVYLKKSYMESDVAKKDMVDPFVPPEDSLLLMKDGGYMLLHNKFNLFPHHLLLLPIAFQPQTDHLSKKDLTEICRVLENEGDYMVFFNRGLNSGASQPHKHIQLIKMTDDGEFRFPFLEELENPKHADYSKSRNQLQSESFLHSFHKLDKWDPTYLYDLYTEILKELNVWKVNENSEPQFVNVKSGNSVEKIDVNPERFPSYNILFTKQWMYVIPRKNERCESVSGNSLVFARNFFAQSQEMKEFIIKNTSAIINHLTFNGSDNSQQ